MHFRQLMLRLMLWSLAAAAVLGAVAILTSASTVIWRVSGTTALTAAGAGLLMAASWRMERPNGYASGLVGMSVVLVSFFFSLLLIWDLQSLLPVARPGEAAAMTVGFSLLCGCAAMLLLELRFIRAGRVAAQVGLGIDAVVFVTLMSPAWVVASSAADRWFESAGAMSALGALAVIGLVNIDARPRGAMTAVRGAGVVSATAALAIALYAIWWRIQSQSAVFSTLVSIAAVVAHANLCMLVPLGPRQNLVRVGTIAAALVTAACADWMSVTGFDRAPDAVVRMCGAAAFVASCGSLGLAVMARMNRQMIAPPREYREATEVSMTCPGCQKRQTLPVGASQCPNCHLGFSIRIEEPRCKQCDYLLFMLKSDRCPECGAAVKFQ